MIPGRILRNAAGIGLGAEGVTFGLRAQFAPHEFTKKNDPMDDDHIRYDVASAVVGMR